MRTDRLRCDSVRGVVGPLQRTATLGLVERGAIDSVTRRVMMTRRDVARRRPPLMSEVAERRCPLVGIEIATSDTSGCRDPRAAS